MTAKEKVLVGDVIFYAKAVMRGHDVGEILREAIKKVEPILKK